MIRSGRMPAAMAVVMAGLASWATVATTTRYAESAVRLVAIGLLIFVVAVVAGSRFAVGGGILVGLIGAVVEIGTVTGQRWERSLIIACLWYVAAELAWDSMERRDGHDRPLPVTLERIRQIGTVLVLSLIVTISSVALIGAAPPRTLIVLAVTVGGLSIGLFAATRHLSTTGSTAQAARDHP